MAQWSLFAVNSWMLHGSWLLLLWVAIGPWDYAKGTVSFRSVAALAASAPSISMRNPAPFPYRIPRPIKEDRHHPSVCFQDRGTVEQARRGWHDARNYSDFSHDATLTRA